MFISIKAGGLLAWGDKGHEIIAQIARSHLPHHVIDSVQFYLRETSFEKAALWMDEIKKDRAYDSLKPKHYINIDRDKTYVKKNEPNIINELELVIDQLLNKKLKSRIEIKTAIMILFHLVGDLHQPLHVGYGRDKGGNSVHLFYNNRKTNLHKVWDMDIIENEKIDLNTCLSLSNQYSKAEKKVIQKINILDWMNESRNFLRDVYSYKSEDLDSSYIHKNSALIKNQLAKAGLRLGSVLSQCFKE